MLEHTTYNLTNKWLLLSISIYNQCDRRVTNVYFHIMIRKIEMVDKAYSCDYIWSFEKNDHENRD